MNPFVPQATELDEDAFIGREDLKQKITEYIFGSTPPLNMAFIGVNHIGTTSLVKTTIFAEEKKQELIDEKCIIPIEIPSNLYDQSSGSFFRSLITQCHNQLNQLGKVSMQRQYRYEKASEALVSKQTSDRWYAIRDFFAEVKSQDGYFTLFFLDRFDKARQFKQDKVTFNSLRELAYSPLKYGVRLLLTSRLGIAEVQEKASVISPLPGIFTNGTFHLGMFDSRDMEVYFNQFESAIGRTMRPDDKTRILHYCGGHPYLLNILGWNIVNQFQSTKTIDVDKTANQDNLRQFFLKYYKELTNLLVDLGIHDELLEILFGDTGPKKFDKNAGDKLELYGLIERTEGDHWRAFSDYFQEYLQNKWVDIQKSSVSNLPTVSNQTDANKLWEKTQETLRQIVSDAINEKDSEVVNRLLGCADLWAKAEDALRQLIIKALPPDGINSLANWLSQNKKLDKAHYHQERAANDHGVSNAMNVVQSLDTKDLMDIVLDDEFWRQFFSNFFPESPLPMIEKKSYWEERLRFLAVRRTYLQHSNWPDVKFHQKLQFSGYCYEITEVLSGLSNQQEQIVPSDSSQSVSQSEIAQQTSETSSQVNQDLTESKPERVPQKGSQNNRFQGTVNWTGEGENALLRIIPCKQEEEQIEYEMNAQVHDDGILVHKLERDRKPGLTALEQSQRVSFQRTQERTRKEWRLVATKVEMLSDN